MMRSRPGRRFAPKFDADGLIVAIASDASTGEVLMVAHMNEEALARTIESGLCLVLEPLAREAVAEGRGERQHA